MKDQELEKYLAANNISYELFTHPALVGMDDSFKYTAHIPGEHCKNLLLQDKKKTNFYHVVTLANKSVDLKKLQEIINSTRLSFVSAERLAEMFNVVPGCVNPFSLIKKVANVTYLFDAELFDGRKLIFCPNYADESILIDLDNFKKFLSAFTDKYQVIQLENNE